VPQVKLCLKTTTGCVKDALMAASSSSSVVSGRNVVADAVASWRCILTIITRIGVTGGVQTSRPVIEAERDGDGDFTLAPSSRSA
jgi:hypothetical protein